jgi:hypothetical protein
MEGYIVPEGLSADIQMMAILRQVWERYEQITTSGERQAVREWYDTWARNRDMKARQAESEE